MELEIPLTTGHFTFQKKAVHKAPDEFVRMAGKAGTRPKPMKSSSATKVSTRGVVCVQDTSLGLAGVL